ncbi:MAG: hypothetical protein IJZ35_05010 [Clostridia bacterium]|nr:hypothetical protein [Clostridia bacterium]
MKKIALILLSALLILSLTACAKTAEEETTEEQTPVQTTETTTSNEITGLLYAVIEGSDTKTNEFMCTGGTITPERIAAGFTGWTGIKFSLTSVTDETTKTITVNWNDTSAMVTKDLTANDGFEFDSYEEMKAFMEQSLTETIVKNIGGYTVVFE